MGTIPHYTIKTLDELVAFVYGHEIKGKKNFIPQATGQADMYSGGNVTKIGI